MYIITSSLLTLPAFVVLVLFYFLFEKRHHKEVLRAAIARGNYTEVIQSIDSDGKEMKTYWEWKLLALFHSGNIYSFKKLYQNYMNEINECTTIERYILSILQDVLIACESDKKPVNFMKDDKHTKYPYTKQIDYQLYHNIRLGLIAYYQPQKNLVKIYFDKFIQQADTISKPLLFYLYYLMTYTMIEGMHPQLEGYFQKTQSFIFDKESLRLCNEVLRVNIEEVKKGTGYENDMNREYDNHRRASSQQPTDDGMHRTFNYQQPSFQRSSQQEEGFATHRHASSYQNEFDALNASVQEGNSFQLYEENEFDQLPKRSRTENRVKEPMLKDDIDPDLDPTWFVRKSLQEEPNEKSNTSSFSRNTPPMQETSRTAMQQRNNPMQQSPFMNNNSYQDLDVQASYMDMEQAPHTHVRSDEPAFINQRNYQDDRRATSIHQQTTMPNPMAQQQSTMQQTQRMMRNPQSQGTIGQSGIPQQPPVNTPFSQQIPPVQQTQPNTMRQQPRSVDPRNQQDMAMDASMMMEDTRFDRFQTTTTPRTPINEPQPKVKVSLDEPQEKQRRFSRKKSAQKKDPFAFEQEPLQAQNNHHSQAMGNPAIKKEHIESSLSNQTTYKFFVKSNVLIFFFILLAAVAISIASSSVIYNSFFNKYPISSDMIPNIILVDGIVALLVAYLIAGIYTGYTIMKKSIKKWNMIAKVLLSPILLILFLLIGAICEVPYLIYASIKSGSEG